jgi:hypothetical protein
MRRHQMFGFTRRPMTIGGLTIAVISIIVAGCSGSSTSSPGPRPTLTASPRMTPTPPQPTSASTTQPLPAPGSSVRFPVVQGATGSFVVPLDNTTPGTSVTLTTTLGQVGPKPFAGRRHPFSSSNVVAVETFTMVVDKDVTFGDIPSFTVTLPNGVQPTTNYALEVFDTTGNLFLGISYTTNVKGNVVVFPSIPGAVSFLASRVYDIEIAAGAVPPTPTPTPSMAATSEPLPPPAATLNFPVVQNGTASFVVPSYNAPSGTILSLTTWDGAAPGAPSPFARVHRRPSPSLGLIYETFSLVSSQPITFASFPAFAITFPNGVPPNGSLTLQVFDLRTLQEVAFEWSSGINGNVIMFPGDSNPFSVIAADTYDFELAATVLPTPTPSPSAAPEVR